MKGCIFVGRKPLFVASNKYLNRMKRKFDTDTAGFSGTLDPFAVGVLVIGTHGYTKLFNYINLEPKVYRAVLWLGAKSDTLDIEGVHEVAQTKPFDENEVKRTVGELAKVTKIVPPKYSAKRIGGVRAYELARKNVDVELKECDITVFESKFISYRHPFVTFEVNVSKGTYVRTLGEIVAKNLNVEGSLSYLERIQEGDFVFDGYKIEDIKSRLTPILNTYKKDKTDIILGKKLSVDDFEITNDGFYYVELESTLCILEIRDGKVSYKLNNIEI